MTLSKLLKGFLYTDLAVMALSFGTSVYNYTQFYNVPEVSKLSMQDNGIFRNYEERREIVENIKDPQQKLSAQRHLDTADISNVVLSLSSCALIGAGFVRTNSGKK